MSSTKTPSGTRVDYGVLTGWIIPERDGYRIQVWNGPSFVCSFSDALCSDFAGLTNSLESCIIGRELSDGEGYES